MTAKIVCSWFAKLGSKTLYIEPGSPWENGYCEFFNGKFRDECRNGEIFYSLKEATGIIETISFPTKEKYVGILRLKENVRVEARSSTACC